MKWDNLINWIGLAGAVGLSAMGLVEAFKAISIPFRKKWCSLATVGLGKVLRFLDGEAKAALGTIYGADALDHVLEGAWRKGGTELSMTVRNGLRMAIYSVPDKLRQFITSCGLKVEDVKAAVEVLRAGTAQGGVTPGQARELIARLESAIDVQAEAAVAAGRDAYTHSMQLLACGLALAGCLTIWGTDAFAEGSRPTFIQALIVGLIAVPIAPVAKDIVGFLNSLRSAFEKKQPKG